MVNNIDLLNKIVFYKAASDILVDMIVKQVPVDILRSKFTSQLDQCQEYCISVVQLEDCALEIQVYQKALKNLWKAIDFFAENIENNCEVRLKSDVVSYHKIIAKVFIIAKQAEIVLNYDSKYRN